MSVRLRNPSLPCRPARPLLLLALALMTSACGNGSSSGTSGAASRRSDGTTALEWRPGDERSFIAHQYDRQVVRCWNVQGRYDCLVARSMGLKEVLPGAPGRLLFFRFGTAKLPATHEQLDKLATSDGYACELASLPGKAVIAESYWRSGQIVQEQAADRDGGGHWTAADVGGFGAPGQGRPARPFFACAKVIDPVLDVGLYALDSDLVSYESVFSTVDYPGDPAPDASGDAGTDTGD